MDKLEPGELVFADVIFKYKFRGKNVTKEMPEMVFGREYEDDYPLLCVKKNHLVIAKLVKDSINTQYITDARVVGMKIIARTGFKNKRRVDVDTSQGFRVEKKLRLPNGTYV